MKACEPGIDAATLVPDGGDLPNGIYRIEYTDSYLRSWGVSDINAQHGIYTYRLEDGHWTIDSAADEGPDHDVSVYQVKGHDLYWRWDREQRVDHLTWSVADNGDLTFTPAPGTPAVSRTAVKVGSSEGWIFGLPLIRIGALD